jgi:RNA polymerase sigma factor (sigma-70 family)
MERSDAELLAATRRGERAAFGTLVERYQGVVCAVTYSSTGDRALSEDVAQDTFLAAWRQLDQLREVGRLRAWLCGIARNLARKARRKTSREALVEPATEPVSDADPFERVSEHESEALVRSALDRVPEAYREVLVLYYREQRSVREVAAALELSEAAALQRLSRGRQYLAEGVANLVERSLRGALPRKSLVPGVLAALPPLVASSHADATPSSHGVPMLKIALFAAAVAAAGTTAVVVHSSSSEAPSASSSHPQVPALVVAAKPTPVPVVPSVASAAPSGAAAVAAPASAEVPAAESLPRLDAATIARTRLYDGPSQGPADAPVTVVVFSDMQCKYCGDALGNLDQLQEDFSGKLRIVVKQMPVHKTAELAAEAALAAEAQGKFWELHDLMMAQQEDLSLPVLLAMGKQAGLDVAALRKDLTAHTYAKAVDADLATAKELELDGTPAFVINGARVVGNRPIAQLRSLVSEALKEALNEAQPPSGS